MSGEPIAWYETPGDAEYPDVIVEEDVPVKVDWWWSKEGRAKHIADAQAEAWDEGVIAGARVRNSVIWDLNPYRADEDES